MPRRLVFIALLLALPFLGLGCKQNVKLEKVTLKYWGVFDNEEAFTELFAAYKQRHPNVTIEYRKLRYEEYEQELLNALAEDRGPDILSVHNTWIGKYQSKLAPLPVSITLPYQFVQGTIKKEVVTEQRTAASLTPAQIRTRFVDVVGQDVVRRDLSDEDAKEEQIWGLPLSVDTLVMFYNQDILNKAGVAVPPEDWKTFVEAVAKITKLDDKEGIAVAGAALGTAKNIPRYSDILSVLMMQNGANMTNAAGNVTFQAVPPQYAQQEYSPGLDALTFYTDFANPNKKAYTWNKDMPDALEAFTAGRVAFFFGYSYHIAQIKARAPQLHWSLTTIPQTDADNNKVNLANYWVNSVSKKSATPNEAWDFIQFAASPDGVKTYLAAAEKPTALRSLIDEQKTNPTLQSFAESLLTAKSWYKGVNPGAAEEALAEMVETYPTVWTAAEPENVVQKIVNTAVSKINQTMR